MTFNRSSGTLLAVLPRDAMLARYLLLSCVRHKPVLYRATGRIELVVRLYGYPPIWISPKIRVRNFVPNSGLKKISSRRVDRIVNKTRRRRRWQSVQFVDDSQLNLTTKD